MKSGSPRFCRNRRGFTLIEVMIVIGIAGLVVAWGVPSVVRAFKKDAFRQAISDVLEACSHARARAILQGAPMELTIVASDGRLSVDPMPTREEDKIKDFGVLNAAGNTVMEDSSPPPNLKPFSASLPENVAVELLDVNFRDQMEMDRARVHFFPNGTSDEFTMVLRSVDGEVHQISLDVVTGVATGAKIR